MEGHTYKGKRKLCYTEVTDFTNFQGIGSDPLYKRYDSVQSVVRRAVPERFQHFLAAPEYVGAEDQISWHIDNWTDNPVPLSTLSDAQRTRYQHIKDETVNAYRSAVADLSGEDLQIMGGALKGTDDDERIYCADGKVFAVAWGMAPDKRKHAVMGTIIHEVDYVKTYKIHFDTAGHGILASVLDRTISRPDGATLTTDDIPTVTPDEGWTFTGWSPNPVGLTVHGDLNFLATYTELSQPVIVDPEPVEKPERFFTCHFLAGKNGSTEGAEQIVKPEGSQIGSEEIPRVTPRPGYTFTGWDTDPTNFFVQNDTTFHATYKRIPWYRRFWLWLTGLFAGKGCLRALLWLLALLLIGALLSFLLRACVGCGPGAVNGVAPVGTHTRDDGRVVDDNGYARPVTGDDGRLPEADGIVAPALGDGGEDIPIVEQPGMPSIIANRLFLFMEEENGSIDALAQAFKKAYPGDEYAIIGYDREVKLLVIQIPENERDEIRQTINQKIPSQKFIVFDEEIYEINGTQSTSAEDAGWHLKAIRLQQAWKTTKGSPNVKIAIVDDGIEASHPMFKGRITDAYNVFTQNNRLSLGQGHGTHTAALAAGSDAYYAKGAAGVAPGCMIMPVQVFDNNQCPLSALVAGVMYAVHHDADVVNMSVGPSFKGLNQLPVEEQERIARQQFKNVEKLWNRVCTLAARKRCILVFAAGNDDILSSVPPENRNAAAIVVTAVDKRLYPTVFTNYGEGSDISAPGKGIYSAYPHGTFTSFDGTSMAAPIVAGTIALMKSLKKDLTTEQARNVLYRTAADVYGYIPPMVQTDKALQGVKSGDFSTPRERALRPVPDADELESSARQETPVVVRVPVTSTPAPVSDGTDYDAIRKLISVYEKKIEELKRQLPKE